MDIDKSFISPENGDKLLFAKDSFAVFSGMAPISKEKVSFLVIFESGKDKEVAERMLGDPIQYECSDAERDEAVGKILYGYNSYIENIGIVI
jgi:cell division protein FtsI/penicillin-binding protein 2